MAARPRNAFAHKRSVRLLVDKGMELDALVSFGGHNGLFALKQQRNFYAYELCERHKPEFIL